MKTILAILAIANLNTVDTHSINYTPNPITYDGLVYQIEEDYSISVQYVPSYIQDEKEILGLDN